MKYEKLTEYGQKQIEKLMGMSDKHGSNLPLTECVEALETVKYFNDFAEGNKDVLSKPLVDLFVENEKLNRENQALKDRLERRKPNFIKDIFDGHKKNDIENKYDLKNPFDELAREQAAQTKTLDRDIGGGIDF